MSRPYRRRPPGPASRSISPIRPRASPSRAAPSRHDHGQHRRRHNHRVCRCRHGRWRGRHGHDCPDRNVGEPQQRHECADRQCRGRIGGDRRGRRHDQSRQSDRGLHHHGQRVCRHDHGQHRRRHNHRVCRCRHGRWRGRHGHDCPDRNVGEPQQRHERADRQCRGRIGGDRRGRRHDQSRQSDRGLHHHGQRLRRHGHGWFWS